MELANCKNYLELYKSYEYNKHNITETLNIAWWLMKNWATLMKKNKQHFYRNIYDLCHGYLLSFFTYPMGQLYVYQQDCHPLGMDST